MRMRHPDLADHQVIDVPDDPGCIAAHEDGGWEQVPDLVQANPALAPGETETVDELDGLRAEYRERFGEDPDGRWGAQRLRDELADEAD